MKVDRTCEGCEGKKMLVMPDLGPIRGLGMGTEERHQWTCPRCSWGTAEDDAHILY